MESTILSEAFMAADRGLHKSQMQHAMRPFASLIRWEWGRSRWPNRPGHVDILDHLAEPEGV